jgi:hypothetical protein
MKTIFLPTIMPIATRPFAAVALAALIVLVSGCTKDEPYSRPVQLGDEYGGGIVFYIDSTGEHGLIAAINDQNTEAPWWNGNFVATNAKSATDGFANTRQIVSVQGNGHYAASICYDYAGGGFGDWFLPSKDQLDKLYIYSQGFLGGGSYFAIYWSSTEYDTGNAWVQDFTNGQQYIDNTSDRAQVHTRAIRAF